MTASTDHPTPDPHQTTIRRRRIQLRQTSPEPGADGAGLASLTVRELIERLARTEEQLNLTQLRGMDHETVPDLTREQERIIRELRRRRPDFT